MKIIKSMSFMTLMLFLLAACDENRNTAQNEGQMQENANPDEVTNRWSDAWTNNQTDSLRNMIADDAILLLNGQEVPRDRMSSWLEQSSANMKDLQNNSLDKGSQGNMVYDSGTFSHGFANDSVTYQGTYTFIWERSGEGQNDWKAKVMHISADMSMDSLAMQQQNQQQLQ